jgi:hypothetical protein
MKFRNQVFITNGRVAWWIGDNAIARRYLNGIYFPPPGWTITRGSASWKRLMYLVWEVTKMAKTIARFPFQPEWEEKMLSGEKTCTSRTKIFGLAGDRFVAFDQRYIVSKIEERSLGDIAANLYRQEGCQNPSEFIRWWNKLHPRRGFQPGLVVFVHHFRRLDDHNAQS